MLAHRSRVAFLALLLGAAGSAVTPVPASAQVPMKVTITVGGRTETLRGTGRCAHEPRASLYGSSAALWLAEYADDGGIPGLSLRYWRFAAGGDEQFSLGVQRKGAEHRISTMKRGKLEGSGRMTYRPTALGGRFEIAGKAQDGAALKATIECARFGGIYAEGG